MPISDEVKSEAVHPVDLLLLSPAVRNISIAGTTISCSRSGGLLNSNLIALEAGKELSSSLR
jgi:hypothetical protein